jgi:hypothetical protein
MPLSDETAPLPEVAAALGRTEGWLMRNWLKLHQAEGFPRKIPGGWVWPRRAVETWLRSAGACHDAMPLPANQNAPGRDAVAAAAHALEERYRR